MFCPKCGDRVEANERFCNKCGNRIEPLPNINQTNINISNSNNNQTSGITAFNNSQDNSHINNVSSFNAEPVLIPVDFNSNQNSNSLNNNCTTVSSNFNNTLNISNNDDSVQGNDTSNINSTNTNQSNSSVDAESQYRMKMRNIMARKKNNQKKAMILIGATSGVCLLIFAFIFTMIMSKPNYYFSDVTYDDNNEITYSSSSYSKNKYSTVIITDNTYYGMKINNSTDAVNLISKDSTDQKSNCPSNIKAIEDRMIKDYGITAVNLCEMDIEFAKEIENVFKTIYNEYPSVRGYLTNVTLINAPMSQGYIAAFMPMFSFATSDSTSGYPWVIKTQVLLNTTYFLNPTRLKDSVNDGSNSGHFPPNATMYSPVAHELGHYLSFLSMMRHYDMESLLLIDNNNVDKLYSLYEDFGKGDFSLAMITEAYNNYKKSTNSPLAFDDWRATISSYAVAKDNSGNYIYDETIAEAFHDVYLNGDKAKDASKYVVAVLKKKLSE